MALTEETVQDKIEVVGDYKAVQVISGESTEVQAICNAVWTDAVKTAYQTMIDAQEA